jgi:hypothetical protein
MLPQELTGFETIRIADLQEVVFTHHPSLHSAFLLRSASSFILHLPLDNGDSGDTQVEALPLLPISVKIESAFYAFGRLGQLSCERLTLHLQASD